MNIVNPWLTPYQRSYHQIKKKLIEGLTDLKDSNGNQLISDVSEGNILVIILSMFAAIAEVIHYYLDTKVREFFLSTARKYTSVRDLGALVGYLPHGTTAAKTDLVITRITSLSTPYTISQGTQINSNSMVWEVAKQINIGANVGMVRIPLIQHRSYNLSNMVGVTVPEGATSISIPSDNIPSGEYYEHGSMSLSIGGVTWTLVDTFAYSGPNDLHYTVEVDINGNLIISFGDGNFGKSPTASTITNISIYLTKGSQGNIDLGAITELPAPLVSSIWKGSNDAAAVGGSDYEDIESLRDHIQRHVRTQGVAITKKDYQDLALSVPGVSKASIEYKCNRVVNLYILPVSISNDISTVTALNDAVYNKLSPYLPITTILKVYSMGTSRIVLDIDVTGKPNYKAEDILSHIRTALYNSYNVTVSEVGGSVRVSDLYALLDNLASVDYLRINSFYVRPWVIPLNGGIGFTPSTFTLIKAEESVTYIITIQSGTSINFTSQDGKFNTDYTIGGITVDDRIHSVNFLFEAGLTTYTPGYKYKMTVSKINNDYVDTGFTVPVFATNSDLTVNITESI